MVVVAGWELFEREITKTHTKHSSDVYLQLLWVKIISTQWIRRIYMFFSRTRTSLKSWSILSLNAWQYWSRSNAAIRYYESLHWLAWRHPPWQSGHLFTYRPFRKAVLVFSCLFYSHKTTVTEDNLGRTEVSVHYCLTEGFINHSVLIYISICPGIYTLLIFLKDNHYMWVSVSVTPYTMLQKRA